MYPSVVDGRERQCWEDRCVDCHEQSHCKKDEICCGGLCLFGECCPRSLCGSDAGKNKLCCNRKLASGKSRFTCSECCSDTDCAKGLKCNNGKCVSVP